MSQDDEAITEQQTDSGAMVGHIQRYKAYISDLKKGRSSGISWAFGRAADILPPEVLQINPPQSMTASPPSGTASTGAGLGESVLPEGFDSQALREKVEAIIADCADHLSAPVGEVLDTPYGELLVEEVFIESGHRTFLLSDLRVIDENDFQKWRRVPKPRFQDNEQQEEARSEADSSLTPISLYDADKRKPDLTVTTATGSFLWNIFFDEIDVNRIEMFDGSVIALAEGRNEMVMALNIGPTMKLFILSGLMVDPSTGNIFVEANEGSYTGGFLNNGWRIHHYKCKDRGNVFYVTEPASTDQQPLTIQVANLDINMDTGVVTYETIDNAATVTLRTRQIA